MKMSREGPILYDGEKERILQESGQSLKTRLEKIFKEQDPDIFLSTGGDQEIFPLFEKKGMRYPHRIDPGTLQNGTDQKWGIPLDGRWHLDQKTSFFRKESGLDGLLEVGRFAKTDLQRLARSTLGNAISSAQLALAFQKRS